MLIISLDQFLKVIKTEANQDRFDCSGVWYPCFISGHKLVCMFLNILCWTFFLLYFV